MLELLRVVSTIPLPLSATEKASLCSTVGFSETQAPGGSSGSFYQATKTQGQEETSHFLLSDETQQSPPRRWVLGLRSRSKRTFFSLRRRGSFRKLEQAIHSFRNLNVLETDSVKNKKWRQKGVGQEGAVG